MLVESDPVEAELFHPRPRVEVLPVGLDGQRRPEVLPGKRVGQLAVGLEMVEALRIRQQVEAEHAHGVLLDQSIWNCRPTHYDTVAGSAASGERSRQWRLQDLLDRAPRGYHDPRDDVRTADGRTVRASATPGIAAGRYRAP